MHLITPLKAFSSTYLWNRNIVPKGLTASFWILFIIYVLLFACFGTAIWTSFASSISTKKPAILEDAIIPPSRPKESPKWEAAMVARWGGATTGRRSMAKPWNSLGPKSGDADQGIGEYQWLVERRPKWVGYHPFLQLEILRTRQLRRLSADLQLRESLNDSMCIPS